MYSRLVQELVTDPAQQRQLFAAIETIPAVKAKAEWCIRWINANDRDFPTRLIAFAIVEGVFFSSSFAVIFWIRSRNLMPGLTESNEFIARDEGMHTSFACLLFRHLSQRVPDLQVYAMIKEAVQLEQTFFAGVAPRTKHPPLI